MQKNKKAIFALIVVAALWGVTFPLAKEAINYISPSAFVFFRFAIASLILFPFIITAYRKNSLRVLSAGIVLGFLNNVICFSQTVGLETISSAQAAFVSGFYIVLVPFVSHLLRMKKLTYLDVVSAGLCLIGLFVFTRFSLHFEVGTLWCLLAALGYTASILYMHEVTLKKLTNCSGWITFYQILFTVPIMGVFTIHTGFGHIMNPTVWVSILICAIFPTCVAFWLQAHYQRDVDTTKVVLIYALEPVFAALFALILNHEIITKYMLAGGLLMLFGLSAHVLFHEKVPVLETPAER